MRRKLASLTASIWTVWTLAYLTGVFFYLRIEIDPMSNRALNIGLITVYVFLLCPAKRNSAGYSLAWYDIVALLFTCISCGYIVINGAEFAANWNDATPFEMVIGVGAVVCMLEATRRVVGVALPVIVTAFLLYAVYSNLFPGFLYSTGFSWPRAIGIVYLSKEGMWGLISEVVVTMVAAFIIFGGFLKATGASGFFTDLAFALAGRFRGGPAKAAVISSMLFGTISGSIAANVATTGQITIPLMKKIGFEKNFAGAIEAAASTGGMFMPPVMGAVAFLIAEFLGITYWKVCVHAFLPAVLYYAVLLVQVDVEAARLGIKGTGKEEIPFLRRLLSKGWINMLPLVGLVIFLGIFRYSAVKSILYATGLLVVSSFFRKETRITFRKLFGAFEDSIKGMIAIAPSGAAVGVLVGSLMMTGATTALTANLVTISRNSLTIMLILTGAMAFLLGMGMSAVAVYLITVIFMAPALTKVGILPIAAHMFLFYFACMSFITPPGCLAAFIGAGIAGGSPFTVGWKACRLAAAAFLVPWAFVFRPGILMIGAIWEVVESFLACGIGCLSVAFALSGYMFGPVRTWQRYAMGTAGLLIFYPVLWIDGIALVAIILLSILNKIESNNQSEGRIYAEPMELKK